MYTLSLLKSFEFFYDRLMDTKYIAIAIFTIFEQNSDIITNIIL
jgi:hypothetical protein